MPLATDSDQFFGAVQVDQYYQDLVQGSSRPWRPLQIAFFFVAVVCAAMVLLSFWWSAKPTTDAEVALKLDRATLKGAKAAGGNVRVALSGSFESRTAMWVGWLAISRQLLPSPLPE